MLTYDLNQRGNKPLYEYLYGCIRNDILSGALKAGEKLPSKRSLAAHLNISLITVENAYEQLMLEGYVYGVEKKGYYAADLQGMTQRKGFSAEDGASIYAETAGPGSETENQNGQEKLDLTSNHSRGELFPFSVWARLMRRALLEEENRFYISPQPIGVPELRRAIAGHLDAFRGLKVDPECIIVGAGTEYLYGILVQLLGRNGMIAVEDPGHLKVRQVYENNGIRVLYIPVDDQGLIPDALKGHHVRAVHLSPSHQFPTGVSMPAVRRHQLLQWAAKEECFLIEDDYDSEFRFSGNPLPALAGLDPRRVVYMNTFSKTLTPSIRIAYMVLPEELMKRYRTELSFYSGTVSVIEQYTLAAFIREGYFGRHINRMRNYYRRQRKRILDGISELGIRGQISIEEAEAGLHFIMKIREPADVGGLRERFRQQGIRIRSVADYCHRPPLQYERSFLINYSDVDPEQLLSALSALIPKQG